jgi:SAM-dependent methyltransferase
MEDFMRIFEYCKRFIKLFTSPINFSTIKDLSFIYFYAGDIPQDLNYRKIGLSLTNNDENHIKHDITNLHDVNDNSVDIYQAEDVFEHIEYNKLESVVKDIYRILKPNGLFRLSVPDYRCDILINRSVKDSDGNIIFDPFGGGNYLKETKKNYKRWTCLVSHI